MKPVFFKNHSDFRKWLEKNYQKEKEFFVGFYKKNSGNPSITWPESVDHALCFGWIDGVRKSIDEVSYYIRFTPRKPKSIWSTVNVKRIEELTKLGLMKPAGLKVFNGRDQKKQGIYSYENEAQQFHKDYEKEFKVNKKAWCFYKEQAPWYIRTTTHWVMRAKHETTRLNRLRLLIKDSEKGQRMGMYSYKSKK
jgi:uncharacterized protein YdeI (YjbR/CyaY-like superfamily)